MAGFHDLAWLDECRERAPAIIGDFDRRMGEGEQRLAQPACNQGCNLCVRECAVRSIAARWWHQEHRTAERLAAAHQAGLDDVLSTRALLGRD